MAAAVFGVRDVGAGHPEPVEQPRAENAIEG
jgi:hypothetical protein